MNYYKLPLLFSPQSEGGYTVTCPLLPEFLTEGDTLEEARANVADALAAVVEAYEDLGKPLPSVLRQLALDEPVYSELLVSTP